MSAPDIQDPATLFRTALIAHRAGDLATAAATYQRLIDQTRPDQPEHRDAISNLAALHLTRGDAAKADHLFQVGLALAPRDAQLLDNRGVALRSLGHLAEAAEHHRLAIGASPDRGSAYSNLGICLTEQGDLQGALRCLERAVTLAPDSADFWHNLGKVHEGLDDLPAAIRAYRQAATLSPRHQAAWVNLGVVLDLAGDSAGALAAYDSGLALAPDDAKLHWNRSQALLKLGRLAEGWQEFEWRWWGNSRLATQRRAFTAPLWQGQDLGGGTLLIHSEQGWGDTLQMLRFLAPAARQANARLVLETRPELIRLIEASLAPLDLDTAPTLLPLATDFPGVSGLPPADAHLPMMSLPGCLGITLETLPGGPIPYLQAPEDSRRRWAGRIMEGRDGKRLAAGVVWQGSPSHWNDRRRSLPPSALSLLSRRTDIAWHSLQKDGGPVTGFISLGRDLTDFAETAAAISGLDLIITVDTAVAHLAGALGRPTWLLLPHVAEWRWLENRDDSPWYPSMRLFRQPTPGDWAAVVAAVDRALDSFETESAP
ncbi:tetratricopeptide repeat-containing glycosyltransferase family protein [Nitrospirillum sp. BR 11752]|uniref:tetratricopeptide repeat-containing glycosyltransferase family protein n=1 Tax=Nitrospirillum sp. BR 11752 TaxID=3104293 RepID=UPI002EC5D453|nr:tetratricopeptide repeat-containing glycosyltransferase family protein [Nitrospirillum sp. BR 11752]